MMQHGACMICLTRLPASKHVLGLSTPLISKIKIIFRAMEKLKHKFREVFEPLKTNVSLTGIVFLHWLRANFFRLIMGV
jgi:hypothetical protein